MAISIRHPPTKEFEASLVLAAGLASLGCVAVFNIAYFLRYSPLPEGWFSEYAWLINHGRVLYRDIYFFLPPVYPWLIALFTKVFGYKIIYLRFLGLGIILQITLLVFSILNRVCGPLSAFMATVCSVIYYQTGNAHIGYDFIQVMNLFVLASCWAALRLYESFKTHAPLWKSVAWSILSGAFSALGAFVKQSNGAFITLAGFAAVAIVWETAVPRRGARGAALFATGVGIVFALVLAVLAVQGALRPATTMLTTGAAASKGGFLTSMFSFIPRTFDLRFVSRMLAITILLAALGVCRQIRAADAGRETDGTWRRFGFFVFCLLGLLLSILVPRVAPGGLPRWWYSSLMPEASIYNDFTLLMVPFGLLSIAAITAVWTFSAAFREQGGGMAMVPAVFSIGMLWGNATSAAFSEAGAFLSVGLGIGILLNNCGSFRISGTVLTLMLIWQTGVFAEAKYAHPYFWWGVNNPDIRLPRIKPSEPILAGLGVAPEQEAIYQKITALIAKDSKPGDAILVFPQTPIFYLLGKREIPGHAVVHWFDFLPDNLALAELRRLQDAPPAMIIDMELPEIVWSEHEKYFRGGRKSGQRAIEQQIDNFLKNGKFEMVAEIPVSPGYTYRVMKRDDPAKPAMSGE